MVELHVKVRRAISANPHRFLTYSIGTIALKKHSKSRVAMASFGLNDLHQGGGGKVAQMGMEEGREGTVGLG